MIARRAFLLSLLTQTSAAALGRVPQGGTLTLRVPWALAAIDPHAIDDAAAALFGRAITDTLFALDARGTPYPALARALPEEDATRGCRITLRPDLVTARGRPLTARDAVWSLKRARRAAAASALAPLGEAAVDERDPLAFWVRERRASSVTRALSHPAAAVLPVAFNPLLPDGTGAFLAEPQRGQLVLRRNPLAARGPAYLERIDLLTASDLSESLRAFEAGDDDVGWLGAGLHRPRPGSVAFNAGAFGWVVLLTGRGAQHWGAPGVAQQLADAVEPTRLSHLGMRPLTRGGGERWSGPPSELLVANDSPHLQQIAPAVAHALTQGGHELTVTSLSRADLRARKQSGQFAVALDFVRAVGGTPAARNAALLTAVDPELAARPPLVQSDNHRELARTLRLGVLGELLIAGAHAPDVHELAGWDLVNAWRRSVPR